jgi:hypothetical protein
MQLKVLEQLTVLGLSSRHRKIVVVGLLSLNLMDDRLNALVSSISCTNPLRWCKHVLSDSLTEPSSCVS